MTKKSDPTEFVAFLKDLGVKALDHVAERIEEKRESDDDQKRARGSRMATLAGHWSGMGSEEKSRVLERMISAAQVIAAAAPAAVFRKAAADEGSGPSGSSGEKEKKKKKKKDGKKKDGKEKKKKKGKKK